MNPTHVTRFRRGLIVLCTLAAAWTAILWLSGGFVLHVLSLQVSSRNPRTRVLVALLSAVGALALPAPDGRWHTMHAEWVWWTAPFQSADQARAWARWADLAVFVAAGGCVLMLVEWAAARPLWLDEQMIALNVRDRSFSGLAGPLWLGQSAPLGWLILLRATILAFGTSELALRVVPVLFGMATLWVAVWIGRRWLTPLAAVALVVLCLFGRWLSHYPLEVKHYSADACFGLLLPALAAWAIEAAEPGSRMRRAGVWWATASAGLWLSNGALLAAPACALVLLVALWRLDGSGAAVRLTLWGSMWLASFALHFVAAIRHTVQSEFLRGYWSTGLPAPEATVLDTLLWLASRFEALALNPVASGHWVLLWLTALGGWAWTSHRALGLVMAAMPLSAFVLGGLAVVPLYERLFLWAVPALYMGVALCADAAVGTGQTARVRRDWGRMVMSLAAVALVLAVTWDIFDRGLIDRRIGRPIDSKQGLNDRAAIEWLMRQRRSGDVLMTTHLALPALWWYGPLSISDGAPGRAGQPGQLPIFEIGYADQGPECARNQLADALGTTGRALVYSGFPDVPDRYDALLFDRLGAIGSMRTRRFAAISRVAVVDPLRRPAASEAGESGGRVWEGALGPELPGCVVVRPARRW